VKYHVIHNTSVGIAFIGTVLVVVEILREMNALEFARPENLDIPGFALVIIGSVLASWSAKKMDQKDNQDPS
jgi:uncharacterized membrane protein